MKWYLIVGFFFNIHQTFNDITKLLTFSQLKSFVIVFLTALILGGCILKYLQKEKLDA